jgi:RNA ligase (TIGR02306 family)
MGTLERKLATIRRIAEIKHIQGADRIVAYRVDGWWIVSQKDTFQVDDLCVFLEIDSFLPVREEFEFLRKGCFKSTKNLGDGFRLRTIKLKGQISSGLILPISDFYELNGIQEAWQEGDDLTEILNIQKYEKPIPSNLQGLVRGNFPSFIPKTDQERYQNLRTYQLEEYSDIPFEVSTKMDGSSMTVYYNLGDFGVCSRNMNLKDDAENNFKELGQVENTYWKVARNLGIREELTNIGLNIAIQGELCGPGIQGNSQNLENHDLFVFDVYDIDMQRYFTPMERHVFISNMRAKGINIQHVSLTLVGVFDDKLFDADYIHSLADEAKYNGMPAEGLVFKANDGKFSFKMISDQYLLNEKD